jgi:HEAT repeat protein
LKTFARTWASGSVNDPHSGGKMSDELKNLLDLAKSVRLSAGQAEEQRRSFAFGNTHFENDTITRATVDRAAESLAHSNGKKD